MQRRVERALLQPQDTVGDALDVKSHRVPVHRAAAVERFEDDQVERALEAVVECCSPIASYWERTRFAGRLSNERRSGLSVLTGERGNRRARNDL